MNQLIIPNFSSKSKDFFLFLLFRRILRLSLKSPLNFYCFGFKIKQKEESQMRKKLIPILLAALLLLQIPAMVGCSKPNVENPGTSNSTPGNATSGTTSTTGTTTGSTTESSTAVTQPSESTPPATSVPPVTTLPSEPTTPPTSTPTVDNSEMIGSLYTRAQLLAMDTTYNAGGYGAGSTSGGKRPGGPVSDQNKYGQYGGNFVGPDEKKVYLTFDCGYEYTATDASGNTYRVTERILDVLKEKNVKAVFFVTMHYVKSQPDLVQRMVDEGHALGNHTNTHPVMPQQTIDKMVDEVMSLHNYVKEHFGYSMTLFRPPTGAFSIQSLSLLKSLGYKSVLWSFQYYDYDTAKQPSHDSALKTVTDRHHNGAIYLLHAVSVTNASILSEAIDTFVQLGYQVSLFQ